jgi:hypothetical protein
MPDNASPLTKRNPLAFTFFVAAALMAAALVAALVTGTSLSGLASAAVQDLQQAAGFGRDSEIMTEQRRQASALEKIEISIVRANAEMALLNARIEDAEKSRQEVVNSAPSVDHEFDLAALRTSLDEQAERHRNDLRAINKRIDWLEKLVYSQDAIGSVQPAARGRRNGVQTAPGWFVLHAEKGVAVIAGKGGAIDVTPGFVIPDLGRVAAIRQEGGRWVVVMDKGTTIRGRWEEPLTRRHSPSAHSPG